MRAGLPSHHAEVLAAMDAPRLEGGEVISGEEVQTLRRRLAERLRTVLAPRPEAESALRLDRYALRAGLGCPASVDRGDFQWSAGKAARRLGLAAVRGMAGTEGGEAPGAASAVKAVLADEEEALTSLGQWSVTLAPAERAAVVAAAASWAARAWVAVPWRTLNGVIRVDPFKTSVMGSGIRLEGRADATVVFREGGVPDRAVLIFDRPDAPSARLDALVGTLSVNRAPRRVVQLDPASGRLVALGVDHRLLEQAVEEVCVAAEALARRPLEEVPAARCRGCHRRSSCQAGTAWIEDHPPIAATVR